MQEIEPEQVATQIIQPTLYEIGERWERNEMTVWQEHLASNMIRQKLLSVLHAQPALVPSMPLVVAACAPEEEHELGLWMFSLFARRQAWRTDLLGQRTPLADLESFARTYKPNLIAISVTTVIGLKELIPWLVQDHRPAPLVLGGRLLNQFPALREHVPGDYLGEDALAAARKLAEVKPRRDYWMPSRRAWHAVGELRKHQFEIAAKATAQLLVSLPHAEEQRWSANELNAATLFLVDTLMCSVAFDVPELVEAAQGWATRALPARKVALPLFTKHLQTCGQVLGSVLGKDEAEPFRSLIARMQ